MHPARTFPALLGYGAGAAVFLGGFDYTGGSLWGIQRQKKEDEFARLEGIRTRYRKAGEETVDTLGEGRGMLSASSGQWHLTDCSVGIYGPGYEERRRRRIKDAYGIEVPETPAPAS